jgi:hypothetical protein
MNKNRLGYFFVDPTSGGFSCSRLCFFAMNVVAVIASIWLMYQRQFTTAAALIGGVAGTNAGVYYGSTSKS